MTSFSITRMNAKSPSFVKAEIAFIQHHLPVSADVLALLRIELQA
jgi:hypothetical protein